MELTEKRCCTCKESLHVGEFYKNCLRCKTCDKLAQDRSYKSNITSNRVKRKKWQDENRKLHNKHQRAYYARKREGITWGII